jgi:integral membrane protein
VLAFVPWDPSGTLPVATGINLSTGILIAHGWFYVLYLFSDFRLWSLMRWPFSRFILIALGGVIPTLSFFVEARIAREVRAYLAAREQTESAADAPATGALR